MRITGLMFADFDRSALGGPSALTERIGARTVLAHALRRYARVEGLAGRHVVVSPRYAAALQKILHESGEADRFTVVEAELHRPRAALFASARKWGMGSWRGGLLGATYFDEFVTASAVLERIRTIGADGALCLDGAMPVLDPALAGAMVRHMESAPSDTPLVFTQAPPGLAGVVLHREFIEEFTRLDLPVGLRLAYRPEFPLGDPINRSLCLPIDARVARTRARFTGDTHAGRGMLADLFGEIGETADAAQLCSALARGGFHDAAELPTEVEIELTTEDPLPETTLRPRGGRVPQRGPVAESAVLRVAQELGTQDDRLVVLGGHGDPLRHPRFREICRGIRAAGVLGLAVVTPLVDLDDADIAAMIEARVDVLSVLLDADSRDTYSRVHQRDAFDVVLRSIARVEQARQSHRSPQPLIIPHLTRNAATIGEMESFFDRWIRETGGASIGGFSRYGGTLPPDSLLATTPPIRSACRRLDSRATLLADGVAVACSEDAVGRVSIGNWQNSSLREFWAGADRQNLRSVHAAGTQLPVTCAGCSEWHRE
ncbi:MAG: radical SAM protein [Phycisphaerales bacterium]|nr:radical SAM protein [Phycisphaerales bacterium]